MFRYIGSKAATAPALHRIIRQHASSGRFADPFGGTGVVGAYFKSQGYAVTSGDLLRFPYYFQIARIALNRVPTFGRLRRALGLQRVQDIKDILTTARSPDSWFVKEYSIARCFFARENACQIAGAWHKLQRWDRKGLLSEAERAFLTASLINSMDAVANTAGTYYAFLKTWHRKALRPFRLQFLTPTPGTAPCAALHGDATEVFVGKSFDILYLDPPYNARDYGSYYHLPESLSALKKPQIRSGTFSGIPNNPTPRSALCRPRHAFENLAYLIMGIDWRTMVLHYSPHALIDLKDIRDIMGSFGRVERHVVSTLGYTSSSSSRDTKHTVYVVRKPSSAAKPPVRH